MMEVDENISVISNDFNKRSMVVHPKKHRLKGKLLQN